MRATVAESIGFPHVLPDADAQPGTYRYADGCTVTKSDDGQCYARTNGGPHTNGYPERMRDFPAGSDRRGGIR